MIKTQATVTSSTKAKPAKKKPAPKGKAGKAKAKPGAAKPAPQPKAEPRAKGERPQGGGSQPKLTEKDMPRVIETLRQYGGIKSVAADKLNVSRTTLYAFLNEHQPALDAAAEIDDEIKDIAEGKVIMAIRAGDMQTVRWYLELKGKDRGYVRRVEQTGKDGGPIETQQKANPKDYTDEELDVLIAAAQRRKAAEAQG
ncbi:helix-turn-helix domain-containing protein [Mesorhizobium sp. M2A.F.Ca.ET.067.02.1.1]|uniref:helix-turn-helix domain-containing protein n=1 Tax=Mesorhizobium sp. M2A.F.Ca.ET.067.02.1.1 TaxID=2496749 RepID=UPI000FD576C5|nr:helix-turn-helix domain-containing protein [Mesorhizobium sp. M2A.F.Ca.ET.067.02.1.1]RUW81556.1 hypothetical protein EOA28_01115 [Mesorhizobium sp. M2A.F.Ca.ET.067.02.1.1]